MRRTVKSADIVDEFTACPYCMRPFPEDRLYKGCCGEVHREKAFELSDGETLLESEIKIVD